jgi:hypothetical protein
MIVTAFAQNPNRTDFSSISRPTASLKKFNPITASMNPINKVAINSARPCPYGCSWSGGTFEIRRPIITATDEMESDRVCHASAMRAMEPEMSPTQYFIMNKNMLVPIEIQPTRSEVIFTISEIGQQSIYQLLKQFT